MAAKLIGTKVSVIKLRVSQNPNGPHLAFSFLGFHWELYAIPVTGSVRYLYPTTPHFFRSRLVLVSAAGGLANFLMAAITTPFAFAEFSTVERGLLYGWMGVNVIFGLLTLIPMQLTHKGKHELSDGINIFKHLSMTDTDVEQRCRQSLLAREYPGEKKLMGSMSNDEAIARYSANPEHTATLVVLVDKLVETKDPRQATYISHLIDSPNLQSKNVATFLDSYITNHLVGNTIVDRASFDAFSAKLVELDHNSLTSQGTRGSVLVDLGRIEEGKTMLEGVLAKTTSTIDKTYSNIFLALAAKAEGDVTLACEYATKAKKIDPSCPALKRVAALLEPQV